MRRAVFPLASLTVIALALAATLLAGPSPPLQAGLHDGARAPAPVLRLEPMEVEPAGPAGPGGLGGPGAPAKVAWQDGVFAFDSAGGDGLPQQAVRDGDDLFTRERGGEWTHWDVDDYARSHPDAAGFLLLDVGEALRHGTVTGQDGPRLDVAAEVSAGPWTQDVALALTHDGGLVTHVHAVVEGKPDTAFVLRPTDGFPFEPRRPLP